MCARPANHQEFLCAIHNFFASVVQGHSLEWTLHDSPSYMVFSCSLLFTQRHYNVAHLAIQSLPLLDHWFLEPCWFYSRFCKASFLLRIGIRPALCHNFWLVILSGYLTQIFPRQWMKTCSLWLKPMVCSRFLHRRGLSQDSLSKIGFQEVASWKLQKHSKPSKSFNSICPVLCPIFTQYTTYVG